MKKLFCWSMVFATTFLCCSAWGMGFFEKRKLDRANKYYEQKEYPDALEEYMNLSSRYPDNPIAYYGIASVYYSAGIYELAVKNYKFAIKVHPEFSTAMYWLGNTYWKTGRKSEAIKYWKMCLGKNPGNKEARKKLRKAGK